jgi:hypothetical protein
MFTFWMFPDGVGATDYGNMGETIIATELAGALRGEGMNHEAALVEGWVGRKALCLASKPFPFGSEMAYDRLRSRPSMPTARASATPS